MISTNCRMSSFFFPSLKKIRSPANDSSNFSLCSHIPSSSREDGEQQNPPDPAQLLGLRCQCPRAGEAGDRERGALSKGGTFMHWKGPRYDPNELLRVVMPTFVPCGFRKVRAGQAGICLLQNRQKISIQNRISLPSSAPARAGTPAVHSLLGWAPVPLGAPSEGLAGPGQGGRHEGTLGDRQRLCWWLWPG